LYEKQVVSEHPSSVIQVEVDAKIQLRPLSRFRPQPRKSLTSVSQLFDSYRLNSILPASPYLASPSIGHGCASQFRLVTPGARLRFPFLAPPPEFRKRPANAVFPNSYFSSSLRKASQLPLAMPATQITDITPAVEPAVKRKYHSKEKRRRVVKETLEPGASVAVIARAHGVNAC
jgi:hypothetical protein